MSAIVIRGDARHLPLPDASVDLVVTSPPYFALRSYTDNGGEHCTGQVGSEPTPREFLEALWAVTAECVRVLKPGGSIWVNLGDKYAGSGGHNNGGLPGASSVLHPKATEAAAVRATRRTAPDRYNQASDGIRPKSLMGLPWRYAIGCIDQLGLILRAEVVWSKPNGLPESVTDRVRRSHEQWFHLVREPRYYAAVDEVREAYSPEASDRRSKYGQNPGRDGLAGLRATGAAQHGSNGVTAMGVGGGHENPLGALPGSVQTVATEPLSVPSHLGDHFAAFPSWWPWWLIKGWSPKGICVECGEGRRPVATQTSAAYAAARAAIANDKRERTDRDLALGRNQSNGGGPASLISNGVVRPEITITGEACACPTPDAPTRPAVVLDPFGGTGTTALMADALGRHGVSVDLSADYCRLADWRIFESGQGPRLLAKHEGHRPVVGLPQRSHPTLFGASL